MIVPKNDRKSELVKLYYLNSEKMSCLQLQCSMKSTRSLDTVFWNQLFLRLFFLSFNFKN